MAQTPMLLTKNPPGSYTPDRDSWEESRKRAEQDAAERYARESTERDMERWRSKRANDKWSEALIDASPFRKLVERNPQ